jgi:hypothetical protein
MPSKNEEDLARLYAIMLAQQTPPTYDDGASLLRRNPMMLDVGVFGKGPKPKPVAPPVDIQRRRLLGLGDAPPQPKQELPMQTPSAANLPAPVQAPMPSQSSLSPTYKALTAPMSRRQFLGNTARTAGQMALRGAVPELAKLAEPVVKPPLEQVAPKAADPIANTLREHLSELIDFRGGMHNEGRIISMQEALGLLKAFDPAAKEMSKQYKDINALVRKYDKDPDNFDLQFSIQKTMQAMINDVVNRIPDQNVFNALTTLDQEHGFEHYQETEDLVNALHDAGHSRESIHDFLDTNHPGYNPDQVNELLDYLD